MELKACPFCGSTAEMIHDYEWSVVCTNENCLLGKKPPLKTKEVAELMWNDRFIVCAKNAEQQVQPVNAYRCTLAPPCSKWSPNGCCSDMFCINKALQVN